MELIKYIFEFLFGTQESPKNKILILALVIAGLLILDSKIGFTENLYHSNRIKRVHEISGLLKDTTLTVEQRSAINKMRDEVLLFSNKVSKDQRNIRLYNLWYILSYSMFHVIMIIALIFNIKKAGVSPTWSAVFIMLVLLAISYTIARQLAYFQNQSIAYILNYVIQISLVYLIWLGFSQVTKVNTISNTRS